MRGSGGGGGSEGKIVTKESEGRVLKGCGGGGGGGDGGVRGKGGEVV